MNKKFLGIMLVLMTFSVGLFAEQLSKIAVVDLQKIVKNSMRDSSALAEVQKLQKEMDVELGKIQNSITELNKKITEAEIAGDTVSIDGLKNQVEQKTKYKQQYFLSMQSKLKSKDQAIKANSAVYNQIYKAIQYVAESNGYSIVLKTSSQDILWYHMEVDITNDVIARLKGTGN